MSSIFWRCSSGAWGNWQARVLTARGVRELGTIHDQLVADVMAGDVEKSIRSDFKSHRKLVETAGSPTLSSVHDDLTVRVERARYIVGLSYERMVQVLDAATARDPARIADAPTGIASRRATPWWRLERRGSARLSGARVGLQGWAV